MHRDLKPANLLRAADGIVKIADFGIARAVEETRVTQIGTVLGTLRYLAPEQAEGREVGPEADVYSLGVVLDELLASPSRADRAPDRALPCSPTRATGRRRRRSQPRCATRARSSRRPGPSAGTCRRGVAGRWRRPRVVAALAARGRRGAAIALARGSGPQRVEPVPHATTPAQQARNLGAWLTRTRARRCRYPATESELWELPKVMPSRARPTCTSSRALKIRHLTVASVISSESAISLYERPTTSRRSSAIFRSTGSAVDRAPERVDRLDPLGRLVERLEVRRVVER